MEGGGGAIVNGSACWGEAVGGSSWAPDVGGGFDHLLVFPPSLGRGLAQLQGDGKEHPPEEINWARRGK